MSINNFYINQFQNCPVEKCSEILEKGKLAGKNINAKVDPVDGQTLLHCALRDKMLPLIEALLKTGADPKIPNNYGKTPEQLLQQKNDPEIFTIWEKFENRSQGHSSATPNNLDPLKNKIDELITLLENNKIHEFAKLFEEQKKNFSNLFKSKELILTAAFEYNHPKIISYLCGYGFVPTEYNDQMIFPAAERGSVEMVKMLIDAGTSNEEKNRNGENVFHIAARRGDLNIFKALQRPYEQSYPYFARNNQNETPLQIASNLGHQAIVDYLKSYRQS